MAWQDIETAQQEFRQYVKTRGQPEAYILLAKILQQNNPQEARTYLETMIIRINSTHHYKRNRRFIGQAVKMLREIGNG